MDRDKVSLDWRFENLSHMLGVLNVTDEVKEKLSKNYTNSLTKMFITLSTPTTDLETLYRKTIYGPKSRLIMLASNIVKKSENNLRFKAKHIFSKIYSVIFEKYHNKSNVNRDDVSSIEGKQSPYRYFHNHLKFVYLDKLTLQTERNHPVHIQNTNGEFSRSAFIPFCSFGDNLIGSKVVGFDMPICNIFKPKLYFDQLCYETDLQELRDSSSNEDFINQLELGLTLVLDFNEERQINPPVSKNGSLVKEKFSYNLININSLSLFLGTIGILIFFIQFFFFSLDPVKLIGEFQFNLQSLKEISVTDSFLGLDVKSRKCQNIETINDCKTKLYIENMMQTCGCLPLSHITSEKVQIH